LTEPGADPIGGLRVLQPPYWLQPPLEARGELGKKKKMGEEENRERRWWGRGGRRHQPPYVSWLDPPLCGTDGRGSRSTHLRGRKKR